ncbi:MAG: carbonic anhydrase [Proteobacteria bacterium]|nr:carbonic anhydrase [Pseudomonadota bacterium]
METLVPALSRRSFFACACCAPVAAALTRRPALASSTTPRTTLTPDQALQTLIDGNRSFVTDSPVRSVTGRMRRLELARSQAPFAVLVSCSDSRVPPELLFGRGLGELFIVRNAGNTVDATALGSIEYAVAQLGVPLVVVMGHERCGAVEAAVAVVEKNATYPGSIGQMIEPIVPAVLQAKRDHGDLLDNAVRRNVSRTVERLRTASEPLLLRPLAERRLRIVGARYDLDDGAVDFFDIAQPVGRATPGVHGGGPA